MMSRKLFSLCLLALSGQWNLSAIAQDWVLPTELSHREIVEISDRILGRPDLSLDIKEDIFRIRVAEMDWDVGGMVYTPTDHSRIPLGADGKKAGIFILHGGTTDHRSMDPAARLLAAKFGFKVVSMSFPGRINLLDPSRDWSGDTIRADGSVRTPIWDREEPITREQYELVEEKTMRPKYGTMFLACAREGTPFYHRMAGWPMAFEETGKALMARHFPALDYSVYIHGHSTGGPFAFMLSQRVDNLEGVLGMETSPFGYIYRVQSRPSGNPEGKTQGELPFSCLKLMNWRMIAMYMGPEALMREGPEALMRLPMLMEEVHARWEEVKHYAQFKAENPVHFGSLRQLSEAARALAGFLKMSDPETARLVEHYVGYSRELRGPGVKPVPPVLFGMTSASAGHEYETYRRITLPLFAGMDPAPKVRLVAFQAGIHGYTAAEPQLPMGPFPAVAQLWHDAIVNGFYRD